MTYIKKESEKKCVGCDKIFIGNSGKFYCTSECRSKMYKKKYSRLNQRDDSIYICPGTRGAINELLVSVDLFKKGFEVFRALSPSCSCDLMILKNNKLYRVEVGTGWENGFGIKINKKKRENTDILAIICNGNIHYENLPI